MRRLLATRRYTNGSIAVLVVEEAHEMTAATVGSVDSTLLTPDGSSRRGLIVREGY